MHEVEQFGHRLGACEPAARDHEGQQPFPLLRVGELVAALQQLDHVITQPGRVGEVLHGERVLLDPGQVEERGHRADGDHEMVVGHPLTAHQHGAARRVDVVDTRYDTLALTYRRGTVLGAIITWLRELGDTP